MVRTRHGWLVAALAIGLVGACKKDEKKEVGTGSGETKSATATADKGKVMACLDKMKDEAAKDGSTIEKDGDVVNIKNKHGEAFAFTYVNDSTIVGVVGKDANTAGVKKAAAGGSALKSSAAFTEMY